MRRILLGCLAVLLFVIPCRSVSADGVLPSAFGGWTAAQAPTPQNITLQQAAGSNAGILDEYGFVAIERGNYSHGNNKLTVTLYRMVDPTAAYGAFTYLRPANMSESKLTTYSAESQDRALIVSGNFLLDVNGERIPALSDDLTALVTAITPKADHRPFPSISDHFPTEGLVPNSERYVLGPLALQKLLPIADGDWLGFHQGAEAMLARYRKGNQEVTLLVSEYPTQQIAAARYDKMAPILAGLSTERPTTSHPKVYSRREAGLIVLAFDSRPGGYGDEVLSQVAFGHNVVWNEPKFTATEPSMNVYIIGAFVGTGAICLIAIVSGLGFALVRILVKYFFPGKVFDRPRNIEIIQLDLNGRSVNTKDFY